MGLAWQGLPATVFALHNICYGWGAALWVAVS
jgi:hypothetical protein